MPRHGPASHDRHLRAVARERAAELGQHPTAANDDGLAEDRSLARSLACTGVRCDHRGRPTWWT
jgi:hypothetical protein